MKLLDPEYDGNTRGVMTKIPLREDRRELFHRALGRLKSGKSFDRSTLFGVSPSCPTERIWQKPLLKRMELEGAIKATGTSRDRKYSISDPHKLSFFSSLLEERDPAIMRWGRGKIFQMTPGLKAILDGILLGDGHYTKRKTEGISSTLTLGQREDRVEWLKAIGENLSEAGIRWVLQPCKPRNGVLPNGDLIRGRASFILRTAAYRNLADERARWYPSGVKVVPRDLDLSNPVTLANWFMGDGHTNLKTQTIGLSTHGFTEVEVKGLRAGLMEKLNVNVVLSHWKGYPVLCMANRHAAKFIEIVRPYICGCFAYKVPMGLWTPSICQVCGKGIQGRTRGAKYCDVCCPSGIRGYRTRHKLVIGMTGR